MNKTIEFNEIECGNHLGQNIIELASALLGEDEMLSNMIGKLSMPDTTLFLPAMPNRLGMGDVASNFRYKHDMDQNNVVVQRWLGVFREYKKNINKNPVVITAVSRADRYMTFKLLENGLIEVLNNQNDNTLYIHGTAIMAKFLDGHGITREHMKKIRMSSEGARFNTYMADMIGFMNILNFKYHPEMYDKSFMKPHIVTPKCKFHRAEVEGESMLQPVVINGKEWQPKPGFNYLYFLNPSYKDCDVSQVFHILKPGSMPKVYNQIFEALDDRENGTKEMIRNYLSKMSMYNRYSDFWVNDIDDAFTILMIINAYKYCELNELDVLILERFKTISNKWLKEM